MAIDKPSYAQVLVNGAGTPAKSSFPATTAVAEATDVSSVPEFDMDGAKALLEESGYVDTDGDGILEKDGEKVSVSYTHLDVYKRQV